MTTFPITAPTAAYRSATFGIKRVVGITSSPFTLREQVYAHPGAAWEGNVELVPMQGETAQEWASFINRLAGVSGSFLMAPPDRTAPEGTQTSNFAVASSAALRATSISVSGMDAAATLKAGDRIEIGNIIYEQVVDVTADGGGLATLTIEPPLKVALAGSETIKTTSMAGEFRLMSNDVKSKHQSNGTYSLAFAFLEVLP